MKLKRLIISTLLGVVFGFVCCGFASSGGNPVSTLLAVNIIVGRTMIGIAIGISGLNCKHWSLHGILMGFIFSLPSGFGAMLGPENPEFSHSMIFISTVVMGMIYGLLIEMITTVLFKAKQ